MKKLLLICAVLCTAFCVNAQKQQTDAKTLEMNFTPFGESPVSIGGIKFRTFSSDYDAIRLNVWLSNASSKAVTTQPDTNGEEDNPNPILHARSSNLSLNISPGIEKHFDGTNRLSPYIGGELNIAYSSMSQTQEYWSTSTLIAPATPFSNHTEWEQKTTNGSFGIGLGGIAGMDFYFADNIYLGAEFGYGFMYTSFSDTKYSSTNDNAWAVASLDVDSDVNFGSGTWTETDGEISSVVTRPSDQNGSGWRVGPNWNGALRLGFVF